MNETRGLWRGKRLDNGEWVEGDLSRMGEQLYIANKEHWKFAVDPSTLGEYTGLRDKNGKLIFEGDILRHNGGTFHEVVFERRNGNAYFGWVMNQLETWNFDLDFLRQLEVIGNIHDNPELLNGGETK